MLQVRPYRDWSIFALLVAALSGVLVWQSAEAAPRDRSPGEPSLHACMEQMGLSFKKLSRQIDDAARNADSLKLVAELQKFAVAAKNQMPDSVAKLEGDARTKALREFRGDMIKLVRELLDLEAALLANDNAQAGKVVEQISATMKEGHGKFAKD